MLERCDGMDKLAEMRGEMDQIDRELTGLLLRRLDMAERIGAYKQELGLPALDQRRELQVLQNVSAQTGDR